MPALSNFVGVNLGSLLPIEAFAQLRHLEGAIFFDSALITPGAARHSIISALPRRVLRGASADDWMRLRDEVAASSVASGGNGPPRGFAGGFVEYDGKFVFAFYDEILIYDHTAGSWLESGLLSSRREVPTREPVYKIGNFQPDRPAEQYLEMVRRAQEYIVAGDIYQVNLAQRFEATWSGDPFGFYCALRRCSPASHAAYVQSEGRTLLSASPELFLKMSARQISTRPIKGTRPRFPARADDEKSSADLVNSAKEIAELVMITDLERNDLGRVCTYGSVKVRELARMERFAHLFHLVSTVEGELRPEVDHVTALRECFPGGSITGAPKKRAREIIQELEPGSRGLYTGAIGYFGFNGESQFNIAIRTLIIENDSAHFHVGAGIVADSNPKAEYDETLVKAAGILEAAGAVSSSRTQHH